MTSTDLVNALYNAIKNKKNKAYQLQLIAKLQAAVMNNE